MKGWLLFPLFFDPLAGFAQDLGNLILQADYTLLNTAEDATGNNAPITLVNAPFAGALGVYSNGNYLNGGPDSCIVWSPFMAALYDSVFAIQLEFQPLPPDVAFRPVVVAGDSKRFLFLGTIGSKFRVAVNDLQGSEDVESPLPVSGQWYTLTVIHDRVAAQTEFYLDGALVSTLEGTLDQDPADGRMSNTHFGAGKTFKGYWRNLRVFGSDVPSGIRPDPAPDLRIFPNPTSGQVNLVASGPSTMHWSLYSPDGRFVDRGILSGGEGMIDLSGLHPGLYGLVLMDEAGTEVQASRIVRQ